MQHLPDTTPLTWEGDLAARMVAGIDRYLDAATAAAAAAREQHWERDLTSPEAYACSVEPNRARLRTILGVVDPRVAAEPVVWGPPGSGGLVATAPGYRVWALRWNVLDGLQGEGLLYEPEQDAPATIIALPDCAQQPEEYELAARLAAAGCRVVVPLLIDREAGDAGESPQRRANMSHREFIYRAAYELGRHLIGMEVQKVLALVDHYGASGPVAVAGYGEGGLVALYAAAVDPRPAAALVSGYFQPREGLWREPIDRNVWALLTEFGDAELAALVAPRPLLIEPATVPEFHGREPSSTVGGTTPGELTTPPREAVEAEFARACRLVDGLPGTRLELVEGEQATAALLRALGVQPAPAQTATPSGWAPDPAARRRRQVENAVAWTQHILNLCEPRREAFWSKADRTDPERFVTSAEAYRTYLHEEVFGQLPLASLPANPRSRFHSETADYRLYEVVLDVLPEVFAAGLLLVPKDIQPGERRPVVVCQHGLEGRAERAVLEEESGVYHVWGAKIARRMGAVVFSPQNPYLGFDSFRVLQRKANPLKLSLWSFIVRQHERILEWLSGLEFVDPARLAFYGLSYGGKTALCVPAVLPNYCLSICSGDYNEWIRKNADIRYPNGYLYTTEYEMPQWNLGHTFNHAELSWLIYPRPFMVERGYYDGCGTDGWVAYEWAKTQRLYQLTGLMERAEIEWFDGPHAIHGVGTYAFLERWLT